MFRNYLKSAIRHLLKNRLFSAINLLGLSVGLTACLTLIIYVVEELNYDRFQPNSDRTYRVSRSFINDDGNTSLHLAAVAPPIGPLLEQDFPQIEESARLLRFQGVAMQQGDQIFLENDVYFAEPGVFQIFDLPLIDGIQKDALQNPFTLIFSQSLAKKYFGDEDPVGKDLLVSSRKIPVKVTGVFREMPVNSHFHPQVLIAFNTLNDNNLYGEEGLRSNWGNNAFYTYLLLKSGTNPESISREFNDFLDRHLASNTNAMSAVKKPHETTQLFLQKLTEIHLDSHLDDEMEPNGDRSRVWTFSLIAVIILLIAIINYMNLSTAKANTRAREIGVRKTIGAQRSQLWMQLIGESLLLTMFAMTLALLLTEFAGLPMLQSLTGRVYTSGILWTGVFPFFLFLIPSITGVLAGLYPAVALSSFRPVDVLKGNSLQTNLSKLTTGITVRKILVVGQFALSVLLIMATLIVRNQLAFVDKAALGYERDWIVNLPMFNRLEERFPSMRNELLQQPLFLNVSRSSRIPTGRLLDSFGKATIQGASEPGGSELKFITVDFDFVDTYKIPLAAGRSFSREHPLDSNEAFLINETAARDLGWNNPNEAIDRTISYGGRNGKIIGVLQDFHFESLHEKVTPMILFPDFQNGYNVISVKMKGLDIPAAMKDLESTWKKFAPELPFSYTFLEDSYRRLYEAEERQGRLFSIFAMLAIFVACLGLFGLATFSTQQRIKEIGIRKVLGASTTGIIALLSRDFLKLITISLLIAIPAAYFLMNRWLRDFAYRADIGWVVFISTSVITILVAFLTVSVQSLKAASSNPVKSLRNE